MTISTRQTGSSAKVVMLIVSLMAVFLLSVSGAAAQIGAVISDPAPLNTNASTDSASDQKPHLATDGNGIWLVTWGSHEPNIGGGIGTDEDILVSRSVDNGASWSVPEALNTNASSDTGEDNLPVLATDGQGAWIAAWRSTEPNIGGGIGTDQDILVSRSVDNGVSWSPPEVLNTNASSDAGIDTDQDILTDEQGVWLAAWSSTEPNIGGGIGTDYDILVSRSIDNGVSWSPPEILNASESNFFGDDGSVRLAHGVQDVWLAVWSSDARYHDFTIGHDFDILVSRSVDNGASWSSPEALNTNDIDLAPHLAHDGQGVWVTVWHSRANIGGTIGTEFDILVSRSVDNGASWSPAEALNTNASSDSEDDYRSEVRTDGQGVWLAIWNSSEPNIDGGIGTDVDILVSRSVDNGASWSSPEALNTNARIDSANDWVPRFEQDGRGTWLVVWYSREDIDGSIGFDADILYTRWWLCPIFSDHSAYGSLLFPPLCTQDAGNLTQNVYDSLLSRIHKSSNDSFYLSSDGMRFSHMVVDDAVHINGQGTGLGPYAIQPGVPPFVLNVPIENNLVPLPAHDVTDLMLDRSNPVLFELLDTQREIYGNTAVYLVRDCGIFLDTNPNTTLNWVSHDVEILRFQSDLNVLSGTISELRSDEDFSRSCDLGLFLDTTQVVDTRTDPPAGDGYYYLVSGTCAQPIGYGNANAGPRQGLPPSATCP